jgi:carboxyl-terminal processing protease
MKFGERDLKGALVWDKVKQADYIPVKSYENFSEVIDNSKQRIASNSKFKLINEYAKWLKKNQDNTSFSLNYEVFSKESLLQEKDAEKFETVFNYKSNLSFTSPKYELSILKKDTILADKRINWHKSLSKDIYIDEAVNVLSELKVTSSNKFAKN